MFTNSFALCKRLATPRSFRLIMSNLSRIYTVNEKIVSEMAKDSRFAADYTRQGITFVTRYLNELGTNKNVSWNDLTKKMKEMKISNPSTKIFQACIRLGQLETGVDYYNYLTKKGIILDDLELLFFCKLILTNKSEIKKHEEAIKDLYFKLKDILFSSSLTRTFIMAVFVEIPECFEDIVKSGLNDTTVLEGATAINNMPIMFKALERNLPEVVFRLILADDFIINSDFLEEFVEFCIRMVKEGKFSVDYINRLVDACYAKVMTFDHPDLHSVFKKLISGLNYYQNEYQWSVHKCFINGSVCSNCGLQLHHKNTTKEDFEILRRYFLEQIFIEKSIFLNSTEEELKRFLKFLKEAKPFDVVFDGLNLLFRNRINGVLEKNHKLKYFLDKGLRVLTIGREHSKKALTKGGFLGQNKYKENIQFFFTSDMSEDDVFLLYACLHGGPHVCFVTGDFLATYISRLPIDLKYIFLRWKLSRQYTLTQQMVMMEPLLHCGLPQLTENSEERMVWHLSQQASPKIRVSQVHRINWLCLTARKRKRKGSKERNVRRFDNSTFLSN